MTANLANIVSIYNKDPNLKKEEIDLILEWLKTQPHLPELKELQVILFLHSCYYDIHHAKKTIENYFTFKKTCSIFRDIDRELFKKTLSCAFMGFLPKKTPDGDAILFGKLLDTRPETYNCLEHTKVALAIIALYFHQMGPADGLIIVSDAAGVGFGHLLKMNWSVIKQSIYFVQEAAPVRIKSIHHLNAMSVAKRAVSLAKPFVKKEIYEKVNFHDSLEQFYKFIPKEYLPADYGGDLPSVEELNEKNLQNILDNWDFFDWHNAQEVDENKRIIEKRGLFEGMQRMFRPSEAND